MKYLFIQILCFNIFKGVFNDVCQTVYDDDIISKIPLFNKFKNIMDPGKTKFVDEIVSDDNPIEINTIREIKVPLDHFDPQCKAKWNMPFMTNNLFFKSNSPIFVYVGGVEGLNGIALRKGFMFDLANNTNGFMVATQHRFYNSTLMYADLKYLHSKQALQDLKILLEHLKSVDGFENSKIVLVGQDYGASLVVWAKQSFPDLIDAAVAVSPQLLAKLEVQEYYKDLVVKIARLVPHKEERYKEIIDSYHELIETKDFEQLKLYSKSCPYVDFSVKENQQMIFSTFAQILENHNDKGEIFLVNICEGLDTMHMKEFMPAELNRFVCTNYDFEREVDFTRYQYIHDFDGLKFMYQSCNEFASFTTTSSFPEPYRDMIPLEFHVKLCSDIFDTKFNEDFIQERVTETNEHYGGLTPNVTHVVFVSGKKDLWKSLGVPEGISEDNQIIEMEDEYFDNFLDARRRFDSKELLDARKDVSHQIKTWLAENY